MHSLYHLNWYAYVIHGHFQKKLPPLSYIPTTPFPFIWNNYFLHKAQQFSIPLTVPLMKMSVSLRRSLDKPIHEVLHMRNIHCKIKKYIAGSSCSKLPMSLFNILLKLWSLNMAYNLIFVLKKCATHIFSAKIPLNQILYLLEQLTFWPLMCSSR